MEGYGSDCYGNGRESFQRRTKMSYRWPTWCQKLEDGLEIEIIQVAEYFAHGFCMGLNHSNYENKEWTLLTGELSWIVRTTPG
jgi:hypothetical protein